MAGVTLSPLQAKYGTFEFPVETETTGIGCKPILDRARRTISHVIYSITLKTLIADNTIAGFVDDQVGSMMTTIRTQLMKIAQPFLYINEGFGDLRINVTGQRDVAWGPIPTGFSWKPKGGGRAADLTWSVDVAIPEFGDTNIQFNRLMEFNWRMSWNISRAGITTRHYSGYLKIPWTRVNPDARDLGDNADHYLEQVMPEPAKGFRRIPGERTIDEAKTTLTFSCVDEELPNKNAPPPGTVDAHISHSIETNDVSLTRWHGTFHGSYELIKGVTEAIALRYFFRALKSRIDASKRSAGAQAIIPTKFSMAERDAYGTPVADFSVGYTYCTSLPSMFQASALFTALPDNDWESWLDFSLRRAGSWHPRGLAQMEMDNSDDKIVDLGQDEDAVPTIPGSGINPLRIQARLGDLFPKPSADESWLDYNHLILFNEQDQNSILSLVQRVPPDLRQQAVDVLRGIPGWQSNYIAAQGINNAINNASNNHVIQRRAPPTIFITFSGWAVRVGYEIPCPKLVHVTPAAAGLALGALGMAAFEGQGGVGGVRITPVNLNGNGFRSAVVGNWGWPVHAAFWNLRYVIEAVPNVSFFAPDNPIIGNGTIKPEILNRQIRVVVPDGSNPQVGREINQF